MKHACSLMGVLLTGLVVAAEPTLPAPEIIEAWEKAGAEQSAISWSTSQTRRMSSVTRAANKPDEIPAFRVTADTKFAGLKEPAIPFALVLSGVTDEQFKALPTFNNLQYILAYGQSLTAASANVIAAQKNLRYLDLGRSQMTAAGLIDLATLSKLETLHLDSIKLTDAGLAPIVKCQALRDLNIDDNSITYTGITVLGQLPNLETLGLLGVRQGTGKVKAFGDWLIKLSKLRSVRTGRITDAEATLFSSLSSLRVLEIDADDLTLTGIKDLTKLTNLEGLALRDAKLTSAGYKELLAFKKLQRLSLMRSTITDADAKALATLTTLRDLNLYGTKVSDATVADLKKALPAATITK